MKYIRVASDFHLEGFSSSKPEQLVLQFLQKDYRDSESVLVLAGDISSKPEQLMIFLSLIRERFEHIIYIGGNHEKYRHDFDEWDKQFPELLTEIQCIREEKWNNFSYSTKVGEIYLHDVRFLFGTLWADGGKNTEEQLQVERFLNDFYLIQKGEKRFTIFDMIDVHTEQKGLLKQLLEIPYLGKTVIITHHMPSYSLCHPRFGTDCNGGFASNCDELLKEYEPNIWIHGHTHDRSAKMLYNTLVVCNPTGYVTEWNNGFSSIGPVFIDLETLQVHGI